MYLTKLELDARSKQVRRDLSDAYDMHRTLVRAFVGDNQSAPPRFLWRQETSFNDLTKPIVLVQSPASPDWGVLRALSNYLKNEPQTREFEFSDLVQMGQRYRFRLVANPTVTKDGKRIGIGGEDEQVAWLGRQGARLGFRLEQALVTHSDIFRTRAKQGMPLITVGRVCFDGVLVVGQGNLLIDAAAKGIGPAKAFGCGLLSLARI